MKYRIEILGKKTELSTQRDKWCIWLEYTDKRNVAMDRSWDYIMFYPHYGIVTDADTGAVEYTFGLENIFKDYAKEAKFYDGAL